MPKRTRVITRSGDTRPAVELLFGPRTTVAKFKNMGRPEKQTILIVDDEPIIRMFIRDVLEGAGHLAKEASNAQDALCLIAEDGITMVVTDIEMPGEMDGLALAREVRARWPNIAVIITSGRRLPRPDEMPVDTRFLSKPFSEERLIDVVDEP